MPAFNGSNWNKGLKQTFSNLWQAYQNNLQMLKLERQIPVAAKENHEIAMERYMFAKSSGIEMREAPEKFAGCRRTNSFCRI